MAGGGVAGGVLPGVAAARVILLGAALVALAPARAAAQESQTSGLPEETGAGVALAVPGEPIQLPAPNLLEARRGRLAEAIGDGVVLLPGAAAKSIEGDYPQDSDFRQENNFLYLTGVETADAWLVLVASDGRPQGEILFIPERDPAQEMWTGRKPSFGEASGISGIRDVRAAETFRETALGALLKDAGVAAIYVPLNPKTRQNADLLSLVFDGHAEVRDVEPVLAGLRLVKDDFEIAMLRRAIEITGAAQRAAMKAARPGMYEYELEAVIEFNFRLGGAERVGFPSIVGSGPNSVVLHYDKSRRAMEAGDLVVMDIGAEYSYYSADVTRTIPVSGRFTKRQREIYDLVLGAQEAGLKAVKPGNTLLDVDRAARSYLKEHGAAACGAKNCAEHFVHGVGHWLGMDVHDVGEYAVPLEPGMVLTVEPGIYLIDEEIGVRIEDDVLVTESGYELLSGASPRHPDQIEALMGGGS